MADDSWRTPTFRQIVVSKIDEAVRQSGIQTQRNSMEMESHVFQKARTKEEYLAFVARLILHNRMRGPLANQLQNQINNQMQGQVGGPMGNQVPNQLQGQLQKNLEYMGIQNN